MSADNQASPSPSPSPSSPSTCTQVPTTLSLLDACRHKQVSVALRLLEHNDHKHCARMMHTTTQYGETPLMVACKHGLQTVACKMLEHGAKACGLRLTSMSGKTALMMACKQGLEAVALHMLEHGTDACRLGHQTKRYAESALTCACERGLETVARNILEHGAEACGLHTFTPAQQAALMFSACQFRWETVVLKLLQYCGPEVCGRVLDTRLSTNGDTLLMTACRYKLERVVLQMLEGGPEACRLRHVNRKGETALILTHKRVYCQRHDAARGDECKKDVLHTAAMRMLQFGVRACRLGHTDADRNTALMYVCSSSSSSSSSTNAALARKMLEFGASACNLRNQNKQEKNTALMLACQTRGLEQVALRMLECGPTRCGLGLLNCVGHTALMMCRHEAVVRKMLEMGPAACKLNYAEPEEGYHAFACAMDQGFSNDTLLHMLKVDAAACRLNEVYGGDHSILFGVCEAKQREPVALQILKHGPEACLLHHVDGTRGMTALSIACETQHEVVALHMLQFGATACNLNHVCHKDGMTALMRACKRGLQTVALRMLAYGAPACRVRYVNGRGESALSLAQACLDTDRDMKAVSVRIQELLSTDSNDGDDANT